MTAPRPDTADPIDAFARRHFTWPGTLHLHRAVLGADILRAPVNVLLAPVLLLVRLLALGARGAGLQRTARWLGARRVLLRTAVTARVEAMVLTELLNVPLRAGTPDDAALRRAILVAPSLRGAVRACATPAEAEAMAARIMAAVATYGGTRAAMSEIATALATLAVGALAFGALTPGMVTMAPGVAEALARDAAVDGFPLGRTLGAVWYGVVPVGPSPGLMAATLAGLVMLGSVLGAFAGVLADPLQVRLGVHRRRLARLMRTLDAELHRGDAAPFAAPEHLVVRVFDLWDAALSMLRVLRP